MDPNITVAIQKDNESFALVDPFGRLSPATYVATDNPFQNILVPNTDFNDMLNIYHEPVIAGGYFVFDEFEE